jgi:PAS domain S-box-containing protein
MGYIAFLAAMEGKLKRMSKQALILLVEDKGTAGGELTRLLNELQYDALTVDSVEEAVAAMTSDRPVDLALIDIGRAKDMERFLATDGVPGKTLVPVLFLVDGSEEGIPEKIGHTVTSGLFLKGCGPSVTDYVIKAALRTGHDGRLSPRDGSAEKGSIEAVLADREIELSEAMDLAGLASWELETETRTLVFNDRFYNLYGTSAEREGGYRMSESDFARRFVHPDDAGTFGAFVKSNPNGLGGEYSRTNERRIIRRDDGCVRHMLGRMRLARDVSGRVRVYGINQDITDRKMAEEALKESEEKYRNVFAVENDALVLMDEETGAILDANDAACRLYGYSRDEMTHIEGFDLSAEADKSKGSIEAHRTRSSARFDRKKDGTVFPSDVSVSYFTLKGRPVVLGAIRDMTEWKAVEDELRRHREDLEALVTERTKELQTKSRTVEELNMALKVLLHQLEDDKQTLEQRFVTNVGQLVLPYVEKIRKSRLDEKQKSYAAILESNLKEMMSPFARNVKEVNFTPREIQVANLIKDGKTTKEIAEIVGVGLDAINSYRNSIRLKLGLNKTKTNLHVYLQSLG